MRGGTAIWPPDFCQRRDFLSRWSGVQVEPEANRILEREVAGGPCIGVSETKQQIDIRRPRTNAV
jgi:hypothetical protein